MTKKLRGIELRYVLTMALAAQGRMTVGELVVELTRQGFSPAGRPSKAVSDALRWEVRIGRAWRRGRSLYGPGEMPRSTEYRIAKRVNDLREEARCRAEAGNSVDASPRLARGA